MIQKKFLKTSLPRLVAATNRYVTRDGEFRIFGQAYRVPGLPRRRNVRLVLAVVPAAWRGKYRASESDLRLIEVMLLTGELQ